MLPSRSDAGKDECGVPSSSGSTSSRRRSAALSACSARARIASSTIGCASIPVGDELVAVESALEAAGLELLDRGENEAADPGWYRSYGVENEMRLNDSSLSMSMSEPSSSGMGMFEARSSDSSSDALNPVILMDSRWKIGAVVVFAGRNVGEACNVEE